MAIKDANEAFLESFLKDAGIKLEEESPTGFIDTGSYALNGLISSSIYGGYPDDRVTALAGDEATGKSYLALSSVKTFTDMSDDNFTLYFETENSVTRETLQSRGIGRRAQIIPIDTIESWRNRVSGLLNNMEKSSRKDVRFLYVLDSLGNLPSAKEMEDSIKGHDASDMGLRAKIVRSAFRTVTRRLGKHRIPLLVINHTYDVVGAWTPNANTKVKDMGGGGGLKYAASSIVYLSKKIDFDKDEKVARDGIIITAKLNKGRFAKPNKSVNLSLSFNTGVDRYYGLLDVAVEGGILKKRSAGRYGNVITMPDGTEIPVKQFMSSSEKYWTKDILDRVDDEFKKRHALGSNDAVEENEDDAEEGVDNE